MIIVISILSCLTAVFLLYFFRSLIARNPKLVMKPAVLLGALSISLLTASIFVAANNNTPVSVARNEEVDKVLNTVEKSLPAQKGSDEIPAYEVIAKPYGTIQKRMSVFVKEKDRQKLIKLNDVIKKKYYKSATSDLYIDYFDNKQVGTIYFKSLKDPKTTQDQKKKLFSHYIATSNRNIQNKDKFLYLADRDSINSQLKSNKKQSTTEVKR